MSLDRRALILALTASALSAGSAAAQERRPRRRGGGQASGRSDAARTAVSYGSDVAQVFDVYPPDADGPLLMFVHGGGWSRGSRTMVHALPEYAARHGLTLASTDYRMVPAVTAREQARDVASAAARFRRDHPGRPLFLLGHSAGAHLAALVGIDPVYLAEHGMNPADLGGVILLDGAGYDATQPRAAGPVQGRLEDMYAQAFGDQRVELSPTLRVEPGRRYPPYLIFHVADRRESRDQSHALADALTSVGGQAEVVAGPGETHRTINTGFGVEGDPEGERAARFIAGR